MIGGPKTASTNSITAPIKKLKNAGNSQDIAMIIPFQILS